MGALAHLAPILGLLAGLIIAKLVQYELKQGEKYFRLLQHLLLVLVIGTAVWQYYGNQAINLDVPIFLFFIPVGTRYHKRYLFLGCIAIAYGIIALLLF